MIAKVLFLKATVARGAGWSLHKGFHMLKCTKKNLENKKFLSQDDGLCYLEIRTYVVIMRKQNLLLRDSEGNVISVHLM